MNGSPWGHDRTMIPEADIVEATQQECSCGGAGPDEARACQACRVYHRIFNPQKLAAGDMANRANHAKAHPRLSDPAKPGGVA